MSGHPVSPEAVLLIVFLDLFKVSKKTNFNYDFFRVSRMTNFNYDLFRVSEMTNFNLASSKSAKCVCLGMPNKCLFISF